MAQTNKRWVLASRPEGAPSPDNFRLEEVATQAPAEGEVLCRTLYLSLDPYMRGRMSAAKSYAAGVEIGEVMTAGTVGVVEQSASSAFVPGDKVVGMGGWQSHWTLPAKSLKKVDPDAAPLSTRLGILGMPGQTAYCGLEDIGKPKAGETLVVAAASGAVGSVVGQIAKQRGLRAVGIAGGAEKCRIVTEEFGFDACIDHRADDLDAQLAAACPDGIDVYFENVGGRVFEAVFPLLNDFARIPVCGIISHYNDTQLPPGPDRLPQLMGAILRKRLTFRGFIVWDLAHLHTEADTALEGWVRDGTLRYREDIVEGLEAAPEAFIGLLTGKNLGKLVVKVSD
ncbi:MAG: NADP-dependent oxidoreductase [Rhodospirillales bacterium]